MRRAGTTVDYMLQICGSGSYYANEKPRNYSSLVLVILLLHDIDELAAASYVWIFATSRECAVSDPVVLLNAKRLLFSLRWQRCLSQPLHVKNKMHCVVEGSSPLVQRSFSSVH